MVGSDEQSVVSRNSWFQFRLRTLIILTSLVAVLVAFAAHRYRVHQNEQVQRASFYELSQRIDQLHAGMRERLIEKYGVGFNSGCSASFSNNEFSRPSFSTRSYFSSGNVDSRVGWSVDVHCSSNMSDFPDDHVVKIEYEPTPENIESVDWIESELGKANNVQVERVIR